jgi:predicted permease
MGFVQRIRNLRRRDVVDAEIAAELRAHLEMAVEAAVRKGMSEQQARRAARLQFGNPVAVKESTMGADATLWMDAVGRDARYALRQLTKSPGFAATVIVTLALGIGANTAIFSAVKAVLLAPLPYKDSGRIVAVWTSNPTQGNGDPLPSSPGDFALWKARSGVFEDMAPSYDDELTLTGQGSPLYLMGYAVSASYLRILGVAPATGRLYTDEEDRPGGPPVVLLSDHLWRTAFHSDSEISGKAITLDGKRYTVLGVMPQGFNYPASVDFWTPVAMDPAASSDFQHTYVRILARLKPGVSIAEAQAAINRVEAQTAAAHPDTDHGNRVVVTPLREELDGDIRMPLLILLGAAGLVLLIACANAAGLALARAAERQKEVAVRLALGATRTHLVRQFMTESLVLGFLGGGAGVVLALAGTHSLLGLFPNDVANLRIPTVKAIPMDLGVLLFALGATVLCAVLSGLAPLWRAARAQAAAAMKESVRGTTTGAGSNRSRSAIVIFEVALSLMLMTTAALVVASFQKVMNSGLGFEPDHLLCLEVLLPSNQYPSTNPQKRVQFTENVIRAMEAIPGVRLAGATNFEPLSGFWNTTNFLLRGEAPPKGGEGPEADDRIVTADYLATMGIPLLRGRGFSATDRAGSEQVAMINATMARDFFRDRNPVGEALNLGTAEKPDWWRIVGVAGDVKSFGQDAPTHAEIYRPFSQIPFPLIGFNMRTSTDAGAMVTPAEHALWSVDPNLPVMKAIPMTELASQSLAIRRASSALVAGFAALALVLACIGIYGVMAYAVTQRTPEIGVRLALGAQRGDVVRMVLGSGLRLALTGVVIGLAGALASSRFLHSLLFQVSAINPVIFAAAAAALVVVGLAAAYLPARRAASIDPIRALRSE